MEHRRIVKIQPGISPENPEYILYWMQNAQRTENNPSLDFAITEANRQGLFVLVCFCLMPSYPDATAHHYRFMLQGLQKTRDHLLQNGCGFQFLFGNPPEAVISLLSKAACLVMDAGYTRQEKVWRRALYSVCPATVYEIDANLIVPATLASTKEEYSAATIRPKLHRLLPAFLPKTPVQQPTVTKKASDEFQMGAELNDISRLLHKLAVPYADTCGAMPYGGYTDAKKALCDFISQKLPYYAQKRNDPGVSFSSGLSPYLHFGQISPIEVACEVINSQEQEPAEAFIEELLVRRELAYNFVFFNEHYDSFDCLPEWAQITLEIHASDHRQYIYSHHELSSAATHDPYWNAAQNELILSGKMHNYMRMYWGKKILEWSVSPQDAFETALKINNRYALDGRGPNAFAGIAWCFGKHDRPWKERPVFGKIRYMNAAGLERKFNMQAYLAKIDSLKER